VPHAQHHDAITGDQVSDSIVRDEPIPVFLRHYLAVSDDRIVKNTFCDIAYILQSCSQDGTRFEIECYDIDHLYTAAHSVDRGPIKPPMLIPSVFGIRGGIGTDPEDVMHMKRTADRLFDDPYLWSELGAGRNQMFVAAMSAVLGGNVRLGLEDSLWLGRGQPNAEQVARAKRILEQLGHVVALADDARQMLEPKGRGTVGFRRSTGQSLTFPRACRPGAELNRLYEVWHCGIHTHRKDTI
jgi:uncharacterized protein (DUF849 family)